jgi:hypothetical protein
LDGKIQPRSQNFGNIMNIIKKFAETRYVRSAIEDKADLSAFKKKPSARVVIGISTIAFSYVIGWPAVGALALLSIYLEKPLIVAIGGPLTYGLSHLVFILGMYLAGANYTRIFLRWATRVTVEKLMQKKL